MAFYLFDNQSQTTLPVNCKEWHCKTYEGFAHHFHKALELIVMCEGQMACTVDNRKYMLQPGDALLFNPYAIHNGIVSCEQARYLCLTFTPSSVLHYKDSILHACAQALEDERFSFDEYYPGSETDTLAICECTQRIYQELNQKTPASETKVLTELYALLSLLFEQHYHENAFDHQSERNIKFMRTLSQFLSDHYAKNITTTDAAQALFMSPSRFSHLINQQFGVSFSKYLCHYRIIMAMNNYGNSDMPVKEIAAAVGFNDYCYFSRAFKQYTGQSPAIYFGRWKK